MSGVKQYACTVIVDASSNFNVSADSPNEAADQAQYLHSEQFGSLCHQCADEIDIGDVVGVIVYADDREVLDTRYDAQAMDILRTANQRLEGEVVRLKAEVEKLNEAPKLYGAVERACGVLPEGWKIEIHCENGAGWVELYDDCGVHCDGFPTNNERLDYTVNDAIDAALSTANGEVTE